MVAVRIYPLRRARSKSTFDFPDAAEKGLTDIAKLLIAHGASLKNLQLFTGMTPLIQAVWLNHPSMVKRLVDSGSNVNAGDVSGMTPLIYAAKEGQADIVKFLIKHGANINKKNNRGETALIIARRMRHTDIMKILQEAAHKHA